MNELIELEERFQPYLNNNDYTFIGPENPNLMEGFIRTVNMLAPVVAISRSIHHALAHQPSIRTALTTLPANTNLRIYVVVNRASDMLIHATIEEYCDRNNIDFNI